MKVIKSTTEIKMLNIHTSKIYEPNDPSSIILLGSLTPLLFTAVLLSGGDCWNKQKQGEKSMGYT